MQKLNHSQTNKILPFRSDYSQAFLAYQANNALANYKMNQQRKSSVQTAYKTSSQPSLLKKPRLIVGKPPIALGSKEVSCETCDDDFNWPDKDHRCPRRENVSDKKSKNNEALVNRRITNKGIDTKRTNRKHIINQPLNIPILIED